MKTLLDTFGFVLYLHFKEVLICPHSLGRLYIWFSLDIWSRSQERYFTFYHPVSLLSMHMNLKELKGISPKDSGNFQMCPLVHFKTCVCSLNWFHQLPFATLLPLLQSPQEDIKGRRKKERKTQISKKDPKWVSRWLFLISLQNQSGKFMEAILELI